MLLSKDASEKLLRNLLTKFHLELEILEEGSKILGTYWGEPEAGLIKNTVYIRPDTPIQSLLHESCHAICVDGKRRESLHTDAGGRTPVEENAVCYLQILLADEIPEMGQKRMLSDMDDWGYSFRLGSAKRWFEEDADDARQWLIKYGLIDERDKVRFVLRK
ncbi:MAG TPA: hypothetical protein EYG68_06430 [Leucothrix mucor]|nr:hypothetical protein [Leucothrix mucor]